MQQKKEQYEDALGSIFDFIFEESKKPPGKARPVKAPKATGVDTTSELIDALGSVLANPLLFVNEQTKKAFDETVQPLKDVVDIAPIQIKVGDRPTDTFKIKLSDIPKIIKDPGGWADKQFKGIEARRKSQRAAWAGEELKGVLGGLWAKERGLDRETQLAMAGAGRKGQRQTGSSYDYMSVRTRELGSRYLDDLANNNLRDNLIARYGEDRGKAEYYKQIGQDATRKFGEDRGAQMLQAFKVWDDSPQKAVDSERVYYTLESHALRDKARDSLRGGNRQEAEEYIRASHHVLKSHDERQKKEYSDNQKKLFRNYSKELGLLRKSSDPDKRGKIKELENRLGLMKSQMRYSRLEDWAGNLGAAEGMYNSVKGIYLGGNLIPSFVNGKFFDPNSNYFSPSKRESFHGVAFLTAKTGNGSLQDTYCQMMAPVYYFSPATLVGSLTDGEVFAYLGDLKRKAFQKSDVVKGIKGFDMKEFMSALDKGDSSYLDSFTKNLTKEQLGKLTKFVKADKLWGDLAHIFSAPTRAKKAIEQYLQDQVFKKIRQEVGKQLLKVMTDAVAKELVASWIAKGGIKVLIQGAITEIAAAIGLAGTPLASAVIAVATWIVTEIIYQIGKITIKYSLIVGKIAAKVAFYGFIGIFLLIGSMVLMFLGVFGKHSDVTPQEVVVCEAYAPMDPIEFPDIPGGDGDIDFECGPGETVKQFFSRMGSELGMPGVQLELIPPGHEKYGDLNGGWWCWAYSPTLVYCKSDKVVSCNEYTARLFKHELTHLRQYRNASGSYGGLFMEWGADYVSGNGGGYAFRTSSGDCIKATGTPLLSGCTPEIYRGIAYNEVKYLNHRCFASLKSYIVDFCRAP